MFRVLFTFYPSLLDESNSAKKPETDREYFGRLANEAIERYNEIEGTSFEFIEVNKVNVHMGSGYIYFITFVVKDPSDENQTKIFQARVQNAYCREIVHNFCKPKPGQEVKCDENSKSVMKNRRVQEGDH